MKGIVLRGFLFQMKIHVLHFPWLKNKMKIVENESLWIRRIFMRRSEGNCNTWIFVSNENSRAAFLLTEELNEDCWKWKFVNKKNFHAKKWREL